MQPYLWRSYWETHILNNVFTCAKFFVIQGFAKFIQYVTFIDELIHWRESLSYSSSTHLTLWREWPNKFTTGFRPWTFSGMFIHQYMIIWNKVHLKTPSSGLHHSTQHTMSVLHHCRGHELITGAGRNLLQTSVFARGDRAGACRHSAKKKEKQQISVIRVSGACLARDGGRSRRWNEKKTVTGAATDDTAQRGTPSSWRQRPLLMKSHADAYVRAGAWLHRYSSLIALDKHQLALTSLRVYLSF